MIAENYLDLAKQYFLHNARILKDKPDLPVTGLKNGSNKNLLLNCNTSN
jgi:hypothetical protein